MSKAYNWDRCHTGRIIKFAFWISQHFCHKNVHNVKICTSKWDHEFVKNIKNNQFFNIGQITVSIEGCMWTRYGECRYGEIIVVNVYFKQVFPFNQGRYVMDAARFDNICSVTKNLVAIFLLRRRKIESLLDFALSLKSNPHLFFWKTNVIH